MEGLLVQMGKKEKAHQHKSWAQHRSKKRTEIEQNKIAARSKRIE